MDFQTAVTLPERWLKQFNDVVHEFIEQEKRSVKG
jgi:hypothetical protein